MFVHAMCNLHCRYGRDYYINDSKSASGSRASKTSGDLNRHHTIDDGDDGENDNNNNPENNYEANDSVSDLDSFYSSRSEIQCRYRYAHLPKSLTLRTNETMKKESHISDSQLKRSHSLCSIRTYGLRKQFYRNDCIDALENNLDRKYEKLKPNHQPHGDKMIAHLERDTLHRDIRRSSFSSRRGTRNFVINPLFTKRNKIDS